MKKIPTIFISFFFNIIIFLIIKTSKINIKGEDKIKKIIINNLPMLMCVWHGRLLFPCIWSKIRKHKPWIVASHHRDAQAIVNIFIKWGFKIIRGSTGKGGENVSNAMTNIFKEHSVKWIGVTNDGPKGPPCIAKKGSIQVAIKEGAHIVSITGSADKFWKFNTWDKFILPKPFSNIIIQISEPLQLNDDDDIIEKTNYYINNAQNKVDKMY